MKIISLFLGLSCLFFAWNPVCFAEGSQWCEDVLRTDVLAEFAEKYSGPVLAIHGREDTTVDPVWCGRIAAASKNPSSEALYIDGMDHTFLVFAEEDQHSLITAVDAAGEFFNKTLG